MINNNPYNIPQKPLKQSKVITEPTPLYPHQINRRHQEIEYKHPPQMMKRQMAPCFLQNSMSEIPRIPYSPQHFVKGQQHLQVSTVSPWQPNREHNNHFALKELTEKVGFLNERIDSHERKLIILMQIKKHEQSTTLSDSTTHTYEPINGFGSRQMERSSNEGSSFGNGEVEKMRQEISSVKIERLQFEVDFKEEVRELFEKQKENVTNELLDNFRESLREKFELEERKMNECLEEMSKMQEIKMQKLVSEVKGQLHGLMHSFKEQVKINQSNATLELKERLEKVSKGLSDFQADNYNFKDHVFRSILNTQGSEQQIIKLKQKLHSLSSIVEKRQNNIYQGYLNISSQKTPHQPLKLCLQSYITATSKKQSIKSKVHQYSYFIDSEGYLLDANSYYILNGKNARIKIEGSEMKRLREMGIMK